MKKSLLIILSLIFMSMTAHAVGVDCWEEHSGEYFSFREPVSKMRDVIDENIPIVRIKTEIEMLSFVATACYDTSSRYCYFKYEPIRLALNQPFYDAYNSYYYVPYFSDYRSYGVSLDYDNYRITLGSNLPLAKGSSKNTPVDTGFQATYTNYAYLQSNDVNITNIHYVHTFCIASDHSSSGGGGGAAGASVNYIIKAD